MLLCNSGFSKPFDDSGGAGGGREILQLSRKDLFTLIEFACFEYSDQFLCNCKVDLNNSARKLGHATGLTEEEAIFLNTVYRWRYPPDLGLLPSGEPTESDALRALDIARTIVTWSDDLK